MTNGKPVRAALYVRVSTDRQTTENQSDKLHGVAVARRWPVVATYEDFAVSGAKGRDQRKALDALLKDATRRKFDVVMVWSIDRIGRSLSDLLGTIQHLEDCGVDLYIDQQAIDTTTPAGKLMFHIVGAFAEFERTMIRARIHAGLARARANGRKPGRAIGYRKKQPKPDPAVVQAALATARSMLADGKGIRKVRLATGLGTGTIAKLKLEARAEAAAALGASPEKPSAGPVAI